MAEARGQGERASSSPTLTSNKGGELMREGARADTCGYRPTPTIKPSTADPRKTLELNPPRVAAGLSPRLGGGGKGEWKNFFPRGRNFGETHVMNRRHVYASLGRKLRRFRARPASRLRSHSEF